ncbi:MAG: TonB-dependent receptor [Bacteroidota bacterium]
MKSFLSLFALLLLGTAAMAQKISGVVHQADGKFAEFATVTLHAAKDSSIVKGTLTDANGAYDFQNINAGQYFVKAAMIGGGEQSTPAFEVTNQPKTLETITLKNDATQLAQVTVSARRPPVEVTADKTILNVEGTVNSTGLNALELLRKAPGVTVDNNDNVSVKGKNAVKVMVDGRDVPLDGKDLAALLKGMQASDIANIEIISNPSAKYDAAGNAGIINIKVKKNKALGTNGNFGLEGAYGITAKAGGNISLNHRSKHVNLFGAYNKYHGDWHNDNLFYREQNGLVFDQSTKQYNANRYNGYRAGADWYINDKHTVGVLFNGSYDPGDWFSEGTTKIGNLAKPGAVDSILYAKNDIMNSRKDFNGNLNYRFADTSGHSFNVDFDRGAYRIRGESFQPNYYRSAESGALLNTRIYRNNTPTNIDITTLKADYEQRLLKGTLGLGFKVSNVKTDNTFDFFNVIDNQSVKDINVSNRFVYKERTTAGYVNYNRMFAKKLHVQAGLRVENTDYMGDLISENKQNGEKVENNYTKLFPSAALTYTINPKLGMNLTYSRRIDRPSYQDLNPFENKLDELTYQKGNPRLRPQFTNSIELSPTFKGYPVMTLGYSHTKDVFTQVLDTTNLRATFITQANLADQQNYTLSLNFPTPIAKWWEGFVSLTGFHSQFKANFREGFKFEKSYEAFNLYSEQTFKLPKGFSVQLSGWYNSPAFWGTMRSGRQGAMDLGFQKKLFDGKGDLRLRFGDILNTAGWSGENLFSPGLKMIAHGNWESRTVTLNFSYRFGSAEIKDARQRKTGLDDESKRVKGKG